jgi:hypothetical protein
MSKLRAYVVAHHESHSAWLQNTPPVDGEAVEVLWEMDDEFSKFLISQEDFERAADYYDITADVYKKLTFFEDFVPF